MQLAPTPLCSVLVCDGIYIYISRVKAESGELMWGFIHIQPNHLPLWVIVIGFPAGGGIEEVL